MKSIFLLALVAVLVASQAPDVSAGKLGRHRFRPKLRPDGERITELLAETKAKLAANREAADTSDRDKSVFRSFILAVTASFEAQKENVMDANEKLEESLLSGLGMQMRNHFEISPEGLDSLIEEECNNRAAKEKLKTIHGKLEWNLSECGDKLTDDLLERQKEFLEIGKRIDDLKLKMGPCVGDLSFGHHLERRGAGTVMSSILFNELAGIGLGVASDQIDNLLYPRKPSCVPPEVLKEVAMMPREIDRVVMAVQLLVKGAKKQTKQCITNMVQEHPKDAISVLIPKCDE